MGGWKPVLSTASFSKWSKIFCEASAWVCYKCFFCYNCLMMSVQLKLLLSKSSFQHPIHTFTEQCILSLYFCLYVFLFVSSFICVLGCSVFMFFLSLYMFFFESVCLYVYLFQFLFHSSFYLCLWYILFITFSYTAYN